MSHKSFWVMYRKSRYRGSITYKRWFNSLQALTKWREAHPNGNHYWEIDHANA